MHIAIVSTTNTGTYRPIIVYCNTRVAPNIKNNSLMAFYPRQGR